MRNNKGISIISFILTILIFVLIGFIGYEIFFVDIFEITNSIALFSNENRYNYNNEAKKSEDILVTESAPDNNIRY